LNNGSITYPLTNTAGQGEGFNMAGNPYPCTIDWKAASGWNCSNVTPTIYTWNGTTYATYNKLTDAQINGGTRYIAPMQGVFVLV